ncbi:response regulator transcription factor [uncultured Marinococcus sp.]|uniref:response regulator transcription factor n=1 Tax=uncultured Marinococcus sp. TaxID=487012 RepID=UPI002634D2AC|nr:response regulator transcription factor [uncultured Marinococcus sp.]
MDVLVVEDNESVSSMLELFFLKENIRGTFVFNGSEGYKMSQQQEWDLLIIDWMLPGMDGITLCRSIRESGNEVPIIMLTAKDSESDQVLGFEFGADDYVTKPFSPLALMARIRAVTRRAEKKPAADPSTSVLESRHFYINLSTREVRLDGQSINNLTPKEFELLSFFVARPKQVFSREQLIERVWGYQFIGDERTVDVHMKRLRKKISTEANDYLHTVWGVGYKFDEWETQ